MSRVCLSVLGVLVLALLVTACSDVKQYPDAETFSYAGLPNGKILKGETLEFDDVYVPANIYVKDSILFVVNLKKKHLLTCYNLNDLSKIGDFISFGSGPGECLGIKSLQFKADEVWVFDQQQRKLQVYSMNQFLQAGKAEIKKSITIQDGVLNGVVVVNDKLFANSLAATDARFSIYDMTGKFLEHKGNVPDFGIEQTDLEKWESFFCNMVVNPDLERIFVSYVQTDLVEIYDTKGTLLQRMHGPDCFFPMKKEKEIMGGQRKVSSIVGETRDAYFYPVACGNEIWTLYSGKAFNPENYSDYLMDKIIVFNWDGKPLRMYRLDMPIYTLAVDGQNRMIYGVSETPDLSIVRFKY